MAITYEPIANVTLASTSATISFTSISTSWSSLRIVMVGAHNTSGSVSFIRINGDSTNTSYAIVNLLTNASTSASDRSVSDSNGIQIGHGYGSSTSPFSAIVDIPAANTTQFKSILTHYGDATTPVVTGVGLQMTAGTMGVSSAITSIELLINSGTKHFVAGTQATLYGIARA
jgi:hypothetical protein